MSEYLRALCEHTVNIRVCGPASVYVAENCACISSMCVWCCCQRCGAVARHRRLRTHVRTHARTYPTHRLIYLCDGYTWNGATAHSGAAAVQWCNRHTWNGATADSSFSYVTEVSAVGVACISVRCVTRHFWQFRLMKISSSKALKEVPE